MDYFSNSKICPVTNAGYTIIENKEYLDIDGTILGTVLAQNEYENYATWEYSYFPKSDFFNGFNEGNYFSGKAEAYQDYHSRYARRIEHLIGNENSAGYSKKIELYRGGKKVGKAGFLSETKAFVDENSNNTFVEKNVCITPFYPVGFAQAREKGETAMWKSSYQANIDCAADIDKAIIENYNNNCLDSKAALDEVTEKYGKERVSFLVAAKINGSEWDLRYDNVVKSWARETCEKYSADFIKGAAVSFSSHSGLVNMIAKRIMAREQYEIFSEHASKDFVSADFQCDDTGGTPSSLCWNFESRNVWLEPNATLYDTDSPEYKKAKDLCSDWGVRSCNDNEQFVDILKRLGNEAYENNAGCFENNECEGECDMEQ